MNILLILILLDYINRIVSGPRVVSAFLSLCRYSIFFNIYFELVVIIFVRFLYLIYWFNNFK